jgi:Sulfotransferase domain
MLPALLKKALIKINARKINKETVQTLNTVYKNIFQATGKPFIIDSSKDPVQAYMLYINKPADFDVKIVGLKRDLRAIAASKRKWSIANKKTNQKSLMKFLSNSLFYKKIYNAISRLVNPDDVLMLNYEELATRTQEQLDKIVQKTGLQPYSAPQYMYVENDHTIAGTPQRFTKRPIAYDNSWKKTYEKKPVLSFIGKVMNKI